MRWGGRSHRSDSIIFFQRIDRLAESDFLRACETRTADAFERDVLSQCWRSSKILPSKFRSLKRSYLATSLAIAHWMALITLLPLTPK
ncbi:Pycsar system effector family protein [Stenotrophomonas geniculata]